MLPQRSVGRRLVGHLCANSERGSAVPDEGTVLISLEFDSGATHLGRNRLPDTSETDELVEITGSKTHHGFSNLWRVSPDRVDSAALYPAVGNLGYGTYTRKKAERCRGNISRTISSHP